MANGSCFATTQCASGIIHLTVHGICMDTPTDDCPAPMHRSRWMSAWTPMIFARGTSMKSEIEWRKKLRQLLDEPALPLSRPSFLDVANR